MSTTAIAGSTQPYQLPNIWGKKSTDEASTKQNDTSIWNMKLPTVGCDLPENGGIGGNLGKHDKPIPGACEERTTIINPETGEREYLDVYLKEQRESQPYISYYA